MASETMILLGVAVYLMITLGVGFYAARGTISLSDYIVAGRNLSVGVCAISLVGTWYGSGIMLGGAAAAYSGDNVSLHFDPVATALSLVVLGLFFARTVRRSKRYNPYEFFEIRFGKSAMIIGTISELIGNVIWLGTMLFTFGILFETLTGVPASYGVIGGTIIVVSYTMFGGLWAVTATDALQMVFIVVGILVLFFVVLNDVGGWQAISPQIPDGTFFMIPTLNTATDWIKYSDVVIAGLLVNVFFTVLIQRMMAAKSEHVAQKAAYIAAVLYFMIAMVPITLGFIASITMPDIEDANAILPLLALKHLHPIGAVLFIGAVISVIMSTSDSILLSMGNLVSINILPRFHKDATDALKLKVARLAIPIGGVIGLIVAFNADNILKMLIYSTVAGMAVVTGPIMLCFLWKKANNTGGLSGMTAGLIAFLWVNYAYDDLPGTFFGFWASIIVTILISLITQKYDPPKVMTDIDGNELHMS
jgi:solute:Na+ symporter, SSS family